MAGIGFVLRNLTYKDNLMGLLAGFGYSALVATGPWLFTILSLTGSMALGSLFTTFEQQSTFRIIVIYNFAFSLVLSGPIVMVITRYVADLIFTREVQHVPGTLLGGLILLFTIQAPLAIGFYFFFADLEVSNRIHGLTNYFLITGIWLVTVFITALKDYKFIIRIFLMGMILGTLTNPILSMEFGVSGMLFGFNTGLAIIFFALTARVFAEYPYKVRGLFLFMPHFKKYWDLALIGLFFNMAAWMDKWIMWFAPESEQLVGGFPSYPNYDSAMFLAYLTIVPSMASFVLSMETSFYERYLKYYRDIQKHVTYEQIIANQKDLIGSIHTSGRNFFILQGGISVTALVLAPTIFQAFGVNFLQLGMFRLGVLGAFYHAMLLFLNIALSYFDFRRHALAISGVFLLTNGGFSIISLNYGFPYYGYGYFAATAFTFGFAFLLVFHMLRNLPYHTFISSNDSVKG
ncbi:exopolysaccharide Pel transporter PelG [Magnetococcus sp. PR-3]|uniref:exopolysaccharide Pel transporter PelG n=1 Tax=Magnetococcus sp. PR-3 TaxID=3120355 RepID=UPI002FCE4B5C